MALCGVLAACLSVGGVLERVEAVDFAKIKSPVIFRGDDKFAFRDPAVVYHDGRFHLFFTLSENAADGGYFNYLAQSRSTDLVHWTWPRILTPRDRTKNFSSPGNVVRYRNEWILCLQTYPTPAKQQFGTEASRLWIVRSKNLEDWSSPELLRVKGDDVPIERMGRMIDPFLLEDADEPGKWWCFYKQNGVSKSYSYDLKRWTYVGRSPAGENVTIVRHGGEYVMFHSPANGIGVKRSRDLSRWGDDVAHLTLGQKDWSWARRRLTAATVIDLTGEPRVGTFVMFFHGDSDEGAARQPAHGNASLAFAWSDDLVDWTWPGKTLSTTKPAMDRARQ